MLDRHTTLREELDHIVHFGRAVNGNTASTPAAGTPRTEPAPLLSDDDIKKGDGLLQHVALAMEDIPEDMHKVVKTILMRPGEDTSLHDRVIDLAKNTGGALLGEIERVTEELSRFHILAGLHSHSPYTYRVDKQLVRGSRPTSDKLARLCNDVGCTTTINLCEEMTDGDSDLVKEAGVPMRPEHIDVVDNTPPEADQIKRFLDLVVNNDGNVYVHCEAGVGRTGVMVACYRLAQGWTVRDAIHEARNFGCSMPDQLDRIEAWASEQPSQPPQAATPDQLVQTAASNRDLVGLQHVIATTP